MLIKRCCWESSCYEENYWHAPKWCNYLSISDAVRCARISEKFSIKKGGYGLWRFTNGIRRCMRLWCMFIGTVLIIIYFVLWRIELMDSKFRLSDVSSIIDVWLRFYIYQRLKSFTSTTIYWPVLALLLLELLLPSYTYFISFYSILTLLYRRLRLWFSHIRFKIIFLVG